VVALRIDVVGAVRADVAVLVVVPARLAIHSLRPALFVAAAQSMLGGQNGGFPLLRRERQIRGAVDLGVGRIGEEAEGILHAPLDLDRLGQRRGLGRRRLTGGREGDIRWRGRRRRVTRAGACRAWNGRRQDRNGFVGRRRRATAAQ